MYIKFLPHSTGQGRRAVDYLLGKEDHKGEARAGVTVLRGNPKLTGELIDSLQTVHRYTSGVIAFAPEDEPTDAEIQHVLNEFERVAFAGLEPNQYDFCAVLHRENSGGVHLHVVIPRVELTTGNALNVAPPKWKYTFDPLRDALNYEHGWARPDDPSRAKLVQQGKAKPAWKAGQDHKTVITDYLSNLIAEGQVTSRVDVLAELAELGEVTRAGADYVSVKLEGSQKAIRLKGLIYDEKFSSGTLRKIASQVANRPAGRGKPDKAAAHAARVQLEKIIRQRADYNKGRYAAASRTTQIAEQPSFPAPEVVDVVAVNRNDCVMPADASKCLHVQPVDNQSSGRDSSAATGSDKTVRSQFLRQPSGSTHLQTEGVINDGIRKLASRAIEQAQRAARATINAATRAAGATSRAATAVVRACGKVDRAMSVMKENQSDELGRFKREINLVELAESIGYQIQKKESSKSCIVMKSGGDKIIVATDKADGHGIYFSTGDESDSGSVIDFYQRRTGGNLGQVRKELRGWLPAAARPNQKRKPYADRPEPPQPVERDRAQVLARYAALTPYMGRYLTYERRIDPAVIEAFNVLQDVRGNACFQHRDIQGVSGWEAKNQGFTGFSAGGQKGLFLARPDTAPVVRIVVAEAAIDLMSWAQLQHAPGTAYVSTGGAFSNAQVEQLRAVFARNPTAEIVLAHDGDAAGDRMAAQVREIARLGVIVTRDRPPEGSDWNDVLKAGEDEERGPDMRP